MTDLRAAENEAWRRNSREHLEREVGEQAARGWTVAEIARRCGVTESGVEALLREEPA